MGLDFLTHAYMNEVLAYAVGAAALFGVVAPNSGNQTHPREVRHRGAEAKVAAPAHRGHDGVGLLDDRAGQRRARIPARSTPRRSRDGDEWVINGHKWFTSNGIAADFFIVMCRSCETAASRPHRGDGADHRADGDAKGVNIVRGIGVWGRRGLGPLRGRSTTTSASRSRTCSARWARATERRRTASAPVASSTA